MDKEHSGLIDKKWNGVAMNDKLQCQGYKRPNNPTTSKLHGLTGKWNSIEIKADKRPLKSKKRST